MSTPTSNSVSTTVVTVPASNSAIFVIDGEKWGGGLGQPVDLTFSFPTGTASFISGYSEFQSWAATSDAERPGIISALQTMASVANIGLQQAGDNAAVVGDIRFAYTSYGSNETAHAYLPGDTPEAGDVWFFNSAFNTDGGGINPGDYDFTTVLHEAGHALGLKHSFESPNPAPAGFDSMFYTVMSYTASPMSASGDNYASFYPTTPMYYDILALQTLYGRNMSHNAGNTTYVYDDAHLYFETIDDASGIDTIRNDGQAGCRINLNPGNYCELGAGVEFSGGIVSRKTVWIGPATAIETAIGGFSNDVLIGNTSNNTLWGRSGNDVLRGGAGNDRIVGGAGRDFISGGAGSDTFIFKTQADSANSESSADVIYDFGQGSDHIDLSGIDPTGQFQWVSRQLFTAGTTDQLRFATFDRAGTDHDATVVFGDTDQDTASEFQIVLKGLFALTPSDFIL